MATFEDKPIKHIALLIAMEAEAHPLIEHLQLKLVPNKFQFCPLKIFQGEFHGGLLSVILNGKDQTFGVDNVGTTPGKFEEHNKLINIIFYYFIPFSCYFYLCRYLRTYS